MFTKRVASMKWLWIAIKCIFIQHGTSTAIKKKFQHIKAFLCNTFIQVTTKKVNIISSESSVAKLKIKYQSSVVLLKVLLSNTLRLRIPQPLVKLTSKGFLHLVLMQKKEVKTNKSHFCLTLPSMIAPCLNKSKSLKQNLKVRNLIARLFSI